MVLANPRFFVTEPVKVLEQYEVAVKCFGWILVEGMKRRKEDAVAHRNRAGHGRASPLGLHLGLLPGLPAIGRGLVLKKATRSIFSHLLGLIRFNQLTPVPCVLQKGNVA